MSLFECKLIADVGIFAGNEVLLVRYKNSNKYDHQPGWFLPDDQFNEFEHPDNAAARILEEQLGLTIDNLNLNHFDSFKGNDRSWHLVFHYFTKFKYPPALKPSDDILKLKWYNVNSLPPESEIAHHGWAALTISGILSKNK